MRHLVYPLVVLALSASACATSTDKAGGQKPPSVHVLHVLNTRGEEDIKPFLDRLDQLSNGTLKLEVEHKWERQNPSADVDAVRTLQAANADLAVVPVRAWHEVGVTAFDALIAPFAIDNLRLQEKVLSSDLPARMLPAVEKVGLKGIGILPGSMRKPTGITRSLTRPADYTGARIGYFPSAVEEKMLQALGATPVRWASEGTSIDGLDGVTTQVTAVPQYWRVMRSVTANITLFPRPNVLVATPQVYQRLSNQERDWLRTAIRDAVGPTIRSLRNIHEDLGVLCHVPQFHFITATADDITALRAATGPVEAWLRQDSDTAHYLNQIAALRVGVTPYPDEEPRCTPDTVPSAQPGARTEFDGTYRMDAPADCDPTPENCGRFFYVFDRGRFANTQENGPACTWQYGTFTVTGNRIEWLFTNGGGEAPTNAQNKPGEHFVLTWSLYEDRMTLVAISPPELKFRPWRRLSAKPNPSALSKRCPPPAEALPK